MIFTVSINPELTQVSARKNPKRSFGHTKQTKTEYTGQKEQFALWEIPH